MNGSIIRKILLKANWCKYDFEGEGNLGEAAERSCHWCCVCCFCRWFGMVWVQQNMVVGEYIVFGDE